MRHPPCEAANQSAPLAADFPIVCGAPDPPSAYSVKPQSFKMASLSDPFIRRPVMTMLLTVHGDLFGVIGYRRLPVNDLPAVDFPVINVSVSYPGASPTTMARNVATPLERQFMQIPGLDAGHLPKRAGQHELHPAIQPRARAWTPRRPTCRPRSTRPPAACRSDLPSPPTFTKFNPNDQPIIYIALTSESLTRASSTTTPARRSASASASCRACRKVDIFGSKAAVRVKVDPSELAARGLTVDDLAAAIRAGTSYQGAGQFDGASAHFSAPAAGPARQRRRLRTASIVGEQAGAPIYLRDVADGARFGAGRAESSGISGRAACRLPPRRCRARRLAPGGRQRRGDRATVSGSAAAVQARTARRRSSSSRSMTAR